MIEIGIARAELSHYLLQTVPLIKEFHGVDPFIGGYDNRDKMSNDLVRLNASTHWAQAILFKMSSFGCRFKLHHGMSTAMVSHFQPKSIDCVFIDGDHTYEGAKLDIQMYAPIIKPGGALLFDDYSVFFPGVITAVDEVVKANNLKLISINQHNNYYFIKPTDKELIA